MKDNKFLYYLLFLSSFVITNIELKKNVSNSIKPENILQIYSKTERHLKWTIFCIYVFLSLLQKYLVLYFG